MSRKTIDEQIEDVVNETFLQDYNAILIINLDADMCLLLSSAYCSMGKRHPIQNKPP